MKNLTLWSVALVVVPAALTAACQKSSDGNLDELTKRVEQLETSSKSYAEMEKFLRPHMEQQKAQQAEREASEPDPNARFAVSVEGNDFDGPAGAAVTIIEAWDFA